MKVNFTQVVEQLEKWATPERLNAVKSFLDEHGDDIAKVAKGIGDISAFMQKKNEKQRQSLSIERQIAEALKSGNYNTVDIGLSNRFSEDRITDDDLNVWSK